jgi:hypothetical protein
VQGRRQSHRRSFIAELRFWRRDNIRIAPVVKAGGDEIMGITLDLQGLEFALLAADQDLAGTGLDKALYRPGAFMFDIGTRHRILLSWEDGLPHEDVIITWKR